jgi:two-component system, NtrC family, response regulator AlgB
MALQASILIIDDDDGSRGDLATCLGARGHHVEAAADTAEAFSALARQDFDAVIADVRLAGLALRREIFRRRPDALIVLMTARTSVAEAVEAMRTGACDYVVKPLSPAQVERLVQRVRKTHILPQEPHTPPTSTDLPPLLASANAVMAQAIFTARQVATFEVPILITGESGTGKTMLATAIHGWSPRCAGPFVAVPRAALTQDRLDGELFCRLEDAWEGRDECLRAADGGTLFLEEVGDLPVVPQAKLIRFLDEHRFEVGADDQSIETDARLIAATNHDLEMDVRTGRFRQDLFFRLNVVGIHVPALRERPEDLPQLTDHILAALCARHRREHIQLAPEVRRALATHSWPGNVRELLSILERLVVLSRGRTITIDDLPERLFPPPLEPEGTVPSQPLSLYELERHQIERAIRECARLQDAANRLGINPTTLWRKRKRYGLT